MSQAWVLLWLPLTSAPTPAETQLVQAWARHEGLELRQVQHAPSPQSVPYSSEIVSHIEESLENARVALDAGDPNGSAALIQSARATLTEHPELPQAAWLMAETLHVTAASASALGDRSAAESALRDAQGLEGPRATAHDDAAKPASTATETAPVLVTLQGAQPGDTLVWDGVERAAEGASWSVPGGSEIHHGSVLRQGRPVWSGWVQIAAGAPSVTLALPRAEPCSADDLAQSRTAETNALVRCTAWVAARPASSGSIEVALCRLGRCEPFTRWPRPAPAAALREPESPAESSAWAAPWGYTFLGVAVVATATALVWSATRPDEPGRTVWVYEGVR